MILRFPFPKHGSHYLKRKEPCKVYCFPPPVKSKPLRIVLADIPFRSEDGRYRNGPDGAA